MTDKQRGLDHFISNPNDVANLTEAEALALLKEAGGDVPVDPDAPKAAPAAEPAKAEPAVEPVKEEPKQEPKPEPTPAAKADEPAKEGTAVLAPDGKSLIPYAVLQRERQRAAAAEGTVSELTNLVDSLTERVKSLEAGGKPATQDQKDEIAADIDRLREEAPDVADALAKINDRINARFEELGKKTAEVEKAQEETEAQALERIGREVQAAIDSNPALVHWRENNPELYEEAKAFDNTLRAQAVWADRPYSERFDKVVELVVAMHDKSVLPPSAVKDEPKEDVKPSAKLTPEQIKAQALAKLNEAAPPVTTITDIPGGKPAEQTENERIDNMTVTQLAAKFESMTPQQQQAYLASIG
ncbi:MAG TPA: hypothetical protein PKV98_04570 [Burkholderiaceae bacterium]|nr:hypothetical protein [Burkholderiaceae bacterium]